jgi:flavin-dependent dehydrogenase
MYDIAIIGLGPSGATLARLIGRQYKVLAIDKRDLINEYTGQGAEKCCGGLLAPDAQEMLAKFGLGLPKNVMVGPQLFAVRAIDINQNLECYYQRHYINVDREAFDRWIVSIIPNQVEIKTSATFLRFEELNDHFKITYRMNNKEYTESVKVVIAADGACSKLRRLICPKSINISTYISIQEWFSEPDISPFFSAIFDEEVTDFYSWTIPKNDLLILGTAIKVDDNAKEKMKRLKEKLKPFGFNFNCCEKRHGAFILRPESTNQIYTGNGRIAMLGEAAGFISPSSAEGLSYGFNSAVCLAKALKDGLDDFIPAYNKYSTALKMNILLKNLKSPFMYNKTIRKAIMNAGLKSIQIYSNTQ